MDGNAGGSTITREDVLALKFPTKLWLLVNTPNKVVQWCAEGESFSIDFVALDDYLCSPPSIFKVKSKSGFISYLNVYGFQSLSTGERDATENGFICEFKHEHFLKGRSDLVLKIVKRSGALANQRHGLGLGGMQQSAFKPPNRQFDPCYGLIRTLSDVEKARLNLRVILQTQAENHILHKKLSESDENSPASLVSVIELPADAFENPLDSISRFKENPEIAGFYGLASTDLVKRFFDAYLPLYAPSNGEGNEKTTTDSASHNEGAFENANSTSSMSFMETDSSKCVSQDPSQYTPNFQIKYSVSLDSNESKEYTVNLLDETSGQITTGGNQYDSKVCPDGESYYAHSSGLEPIYRNCDEDADVSNKEEDISMDQYLKFKSSPQKSSGEVENVSQDIKMEQEFKTETETHSNEDANDDTENFRNFFNQYRESINLLYE